MCLFDQLNLKGTKAFFSFVSLFFFFLFSPFSSYSNLDLFVKGEMINLLTFLFDPFNTDLSISNFIIGFSDVSKSYYSCWNCSICDYLGIVCYYFLFLYLNLQLLIASFITILQHKYIIRQNNKSPIMNMAMFLPDHAVL